MTNFSFYLSSAPEIYTCALYIIFKTIAKFSEPNFLPHQVYFPQKYTYKALILLESAFHAFFGFNLLFSLSFVFTNECCHIVGIPSELPFILRFSPSCLLFVRNESRKSSFPASCFLHCLYSKNP